MYHAAEKDVMLGLTVGKRRKMLDDLTEWIEHILPELRSLIEYHNAYTIHNICP